MNVRWQHLRKESSRKKFRYGLETVGGRERRGCDRHKIDQWREVWTGNRRIRTKKSVSQVNKFSVFSLDRGTGELRGGLK